MTAIIPTHYLFNAFPELNTLEKAHFKRPISLLALGVGVILVGKVGEWLGRKIMVNCRENNDFDKVFNRVGQIIMIGSSILGLTATIPLFFGGGWCALNVGEKLLNTTKSQDAFLKIGAIAFGSLFSSSTLHFFQWQILFNGR